MNSRTATGGAPDPDRNLREDFKDAAKQIAAEVKWAKKSRTNINIKPKIVSQLRNALNLGMDVFEHEHGEMERPEKKEVTVWAQARATELMQKTSHLRRDNRMFDFGSKISADLVLAYKKGWSLLAGNTQLLTSEKQIFTSNPDVAIPEKYRDAILRSIIHKITGDMAGGIGIWEIRENTFDRKRRYLPTRVVRGEEEISLKNDPDTTSLSDAAGASMLKRGFFEEGVFRLTDGSPYRFVQLTPRGFAAAEIHIEQKVEDDLKWRRSAEFTRRLDYMGRNLTEEERGVSLYQDDLDQFRKYRAYVDAKSEPENREPEV
ncbi:hypothetical protein [Pseudosulfitobacter pseudonitzschiae]|uniref:hypothetical protein n=1 Tax=Pseudosulfitobacter pseudonitzschiae TaxID=1402135 RepID=UPI003B81DAA0